MFQKLDLNQDGKLQLEEMIAGYKKYFGEFSLVRVNKVFGLVDTDNSGEIDFSEFVTATVNRMELLNEQKLKDAFNLYDKDGGGTISIDELKMVLGNGQDISDEIWEEIVHEIDENGDGEVDFGEFKAMM